MARLVHYTVNATPVQTTGVTVTTVHSWTPASHSPAADNCTAFAVVTMIGKGAAGISVTLQTGATYSIVSGTVSLLGTQTTILAAQGTAALLTSAVTLDASSNVIRARIAGIAATTLDWTAYIEIRTTELG